MKYFILGCGCQPWCCYDIGTSSTLLALCEGNPLVTSGFPTQRASNEDSCVNTLSAFSLFPKLFLFLQCIDKYEMWKSRCSSPIPHFRVGELVIWPWACYALRILFVYYSEMLQLYIHETSGCLVWWILRNRKETVLIKDLSPGALCHMYLLTANAATGIWPPSSHVFDVLSRLCCIERENVFDYLNGISMSLNRNRFVDGTDLVPISICIVI